MSLSDELKLSDIMETKDLVEEYNDGEILEIPDVIDVTKMGNGLITKIATMHLQGWTTGQIGTELNLKPKVIRDIKATQQFRDIADTITAKVVDTSRDLIKATTLKAVQTLFEVLESGSDKVRLGAAQDILNRVGLKQAETINIVAKNDDTAHMSEEELKDLVRLGIDEILGERSDES